MKYAKETTLQFTGVDGQEVTVIISTPPSYNSSLWRYDFKYANIKTAHSSVRFCIRPFNLTRSEDGWCKSVFLDYISESDLDRVIEAYYQ